MINPTTSKQVEQSAAVYTKLATILQRCYDKQLMLCPNLGGFLAPPINYQKFNQFYELFCNQKSFFVVVIYSCSHLNYNHHCIKLAFMPARIVTIVSYTCKILTNLYFNDYDIVG